MEQTTAEERSYIAFISYRHKPLDKRAAERIQRSIEGYTIPKELRGPGNEKRLGKVFRDEDELPASSSLSNSITYALDHSQYLLVICTPDLPESRWCEQEIRYFLETHDRDHVLAVLADGQPEASFSPYLLHTFDEQGNVTGDTEPLAANIAGRGHSIDRRAYRKEIVRIYAALLGCPFDALWQRERRARTNRLTAALGVGLAILAGFFGVVLSKNARITKQNKQITEQNEQINQQNVSLKRQLSASLVDNGYALLEGYDRKGALQSALDALMDGEEPSIYDHRVEKLLDNALGAYRSGAWKSSLLYERSTNIIDMAITKDGQRAALLDHIGNIACISTDTGETLWEAVSFGGYVSDVYPSSRVYISDNMGLVLCQTIRGVFAFSLADGLPQWTYLRNEQAQNTFFCLSPDGLYFMILDALLEDTESFDLVLCSARTGKRLMAIDLGEEGYLVKPSPYLEEFCFGGTFSEDEHYFGFCAYANPPEREENGRFQYYLIDLETYEQVHAAKYDTDQSVSYFVYGLYVANRTGDMFCAQYFHGYGGIATFSMNWAKDQFSQEFTNYTLRTDTGHYLSLEEVGYIPMMMGKFYALVFAQETLFLFDKTSGELRKAFGFTGTIINAFWIDEAASKVVMLLDNGSEVMYQLGSGDNPFKGYSIQSMDQSELSLAVPVRGGLYKNSNTGMYLTVRKAKQNQVLAVRSVTDSSGVQLPQQPGSGYARKLYPTPNGDAVLALFTKNGETTAILYSTETDRMLQKATFSEYFLDEVAVIDQNSFLYRKKIYHMDGTFTYIDRLTEENQVRLSDTNFMRAQLFNGQVLTVCNNGSAYKPRLSPIWLDNTMVPESNDTNKGLAFQSCDLMTVGENGYVLCYGTYVYVQEDETLFTAEAPCYVAFNALDPKRIVLADPHPEAASRAAVLGRETPVFASFDDAGGFTLFNILTGETHSLEMQYAPEEPMLFSFSPQDRYFVVLTATGRIDCFDAATGELYYSEQTISDPYQHGSLACYSSEDGRQLYLLIKGVNETGYFMGIDTEDWIETCSASSVYAYVPADNSIYTDRGNSILRYPVHSLSDLAAWARRELA